MSDRVTGGRTHALTERAASARENGDRVVRCPPPGLTIAHGRSIKPGAAGAVPQMMVHTTVGRPGVRNGEGNEHARLPLPAAARRDQPRAHGRSNSGRRETTRLGFRLGANPPAGANQMMAVGKAGSDARSNELAADATDDRQEDDGADEHLHRGMKIVRSVPRPGRGPVTASRARCR
ncbi:hypothetical protein ABZ801_20240 [Actinomadura sp. NPDC047616]|uniref:hypothetical protein n=1 Tax=Actinomadura sp. NPDC047616 TaxID=3155914 RepID=UPI0033FE52A6